MVAIAYNTLAGRLLHAAVSLRVIDPPPAGVVARQEFLDSLAWSEELRLALTHLVGEHPTLPDAPPPSRRLVRSQILMAGGSAAEVFALPVLATESLSDVDRQTIFGEAFLRVAVAQGSLTPELAAQSRAEREPRHTSWPSDWLFEGGHLDPVSGMLALVEVDDEPLRTCVGCLQLLGEAGRCAVCAQGYLATATKTGSTRPSRPSGGTLAPERDGVVDSGEDPFLEGSYFAAYEIVRRLGEGGMGVVFVARDPALNRNVALKILRGGALASSSSKRRFLFEAEAAAALKHPNIVQVHQIGEHLGYCYYAMDLIEEGVPFDEWGVQAQIPELIEATAQIADAVHHFHQRGILHRDLKPDNIVVDREGTPRILDFGIARSLGAKDEDSKGWTVEGDVLGTPWYMAPEQAAGDLAQIDVRCDVYALGAILYHLLSGAAPYAGLSAKEVLAQIPTLDPPPIRTLRKDLDSDLAALIGVAMAREPERRYGGADELRDDLRRHLACEPLRAQAPTLGYRLSKFVARNRGRVALAGVAVVLLLGLAIAFAVERMQHGRQVRSILDRAERASLEERVVLLEEARTLAPRDRVVELSLIQARQAEDQARRAAEELRSRSQRELTAEAQRELEREREYRRLTEAKQAAASVMTLLEARQAAGRKAHREAVARVEALLEDAESSLDPFRRYGTLSEALYRIPLREAELKLQVEEAFLDCTLQLAEGALEARLAGLAEFWIHEARKVEATDDRKHEIDELEAAAHELASPSSDDER